MKSGTECSTQDSELSVVAGEQGECSGDGAEEVGGMKCFLLSDSPHSTVKSPSFLFIPLDHQSSA